jgi:protein-tyrosine-phosphatase
MNVLFVCFGNAYRSPLAEALLKKLRPDLEVDSAGLHVAIPISMEVKEYLKRHDAAQYLKAYPESIGEKNLRDYAVIVTMDDHVKDAVLRRCPDCVDRIVEWNIRDPYFEAEEAENIFNEIKSKVEEQFQS